MAVPPEVNASVMFIVGWLGPLPVPYCVNDRMKYPLTPLAVRPDIVPDLRNIFWLRDRLTEGVDVTMIRWPSNAIPETSKMAPLGLCRAEDIPEILKVPPPEKSIYGNPEPVPRDDVARIGPLIPVIAGGVNVTA